MGKALKVTAIILGIGSAAVAAAAVYVDNIYPKCSSETVKSGLRKSIVIGGDQIVFNHIATEGRNGNKIICSTAFEFKSTGNANQDSLLSMITESARHNGGGRIFYTIIKDDDGQTWVEVIGAK